MSEIVEPRTLSGFMELLPKDQVIFEKIKSEMEKVYRRYGFYPLDTPVLEDSRILLAKAGQRSRFTDLTRVIQTLLCVLTLRFLLQSMLQRIIQS